MSKWRKYLLGSWSWKRPIYSIVSIYLLLLIIVLFFANKLIFPAPKDTYDENLKNLVMLENAKGQKVAALYFKGSPDQPTLLWSHGNAEDLMSLYPLVERLSEYQGYNVLAYDYPGYGLSDGSPDEQGCYDNISAAWQYLTKELKVPENKIILVGQSVGTGPSTWLAAEDDVNPAGLVLIAPFQSINRVPFGVNLFPKDRFPNIERIGKVSCPLLVIHGDKDKVIRQSHGKAIFDAHQGEKEFINAKDHGHNNIWAYGAVYDGLYDFITKVSK